jgi:hypothetical protein
VADGAPDIRRRNNTYSLSALGTCSPRALVALSCYLSTAGGPQALLGHCTCALPRLAPHSSSAHLFYGASFHPLSVPSCSISYIPVLLLEQAHLRGRCSKQRLLGCDCVYTTNWAAKHNWLDGHTHTHEYACVTLGSSRTRDREARPYGIWRLLSARTSQAVPQTWRAHRKAPSPQAFTGPSRSPTRASR